MKNTEKGGKVFHSFIAGKIEHTMLRQDAVRKDIDLLCEEAIKFGFYGVCVNSSWVETVKANLQGYPDIRIVTVAGFPLGAASAYSKNMEIEQAIEDGADEADMVMNIGKLKDCEYGFLEKEIRHIKESGDFILKIIVETGVLTQYQKEAACQVVLDSGADFIKTSTGFFGPGANVQDVGLFKKMVGDKIGIKASGGIADLAAARALLEAGADRLGCSRSVNIYGEEEREFSGR